MLGLVLDDDICHNKQKEIESMKVTRFCYRHVRILARV